MLSLVATLAVLAQTPDVPPPPPPPPPAAEPTPAPLPPPPEATAAPATPADAPTRSGAYAGRSRGWLLEEKKWLEETRPVIAPHALIAGGGAILLFAAILNAVVRPSLGGNGQIPGGFLAVFGIMGGAGMVTGGLFLIFAMQKAQTVDVEIEAVKDALRSAPDDVPAPRDDRDEEAPPGMPPAMPPQVQLPPAPTINVVLATF